MVVGGVLFGLLLWSRPAAAYPWMIRHEYAGCAMCHADPSGGGVLTPYGRAQGDLLLRMRYGKEKPEEVEPSKTAGFLFGAFETPEWLLLGGSGRALMLVNNVGGQGTTPASTTLRFIQMQTDLRAVVRPSFLRMGGSLGYAHQGALPASLTARPQDNLVSREHWAGVGLKDDTILIRAGRMNLPFGVRNIDHTLWVRNATRTDINEQQQHGVAFAYNGDKLRGEVMGILGNYQIHPDAYRERGAAGFVEYTFAPKYVFGVNGLFASALLDAQTRTTRRRGAGGLFGRAVPAEPLVLTAELDALVDAQAGKATSVGAVGMLQADYQMVQGLHAMLTGEFLNDTNGTSEGGWLGAWWFFAPHMDLRVDGILRSQAAAGQHTLVTSFLAQLHVFL